jgi:hypothetical protein
MISLCDSVCPGEPAAAKMANLIYGRARLLPSFPTIPGSASVPLRPRSPCTIQFSSLSALFIQFWAASEPEMPGDTRRWLSSEDHQVLIGVGSTFFHFLSWWRSSAVVSSRFWMKSSIHSCECGVFHSCKCGVFQIWPKFWLYIRVHIKSPIYP